MKLLATIRESDVYSDHQDNHEPPSKTRQAARAVVLDENGRVALLKVNKWSYHKLPGGGVEVGEDMRQALARELMEEIGCEADVLDEIGEIIEYRDKWGLMQTSDCYLAQKRGQQRTASFDAGEIADDFEMYWSANIDEAIKILEVDRPQNYDGHFIQKRDILLLGAAKRAMNNVDNT